MTNQETLTNNKTSIPQIKATNSFALVPKDFISKKIESIKKDSSEENIKEVFSEIFYTGVAYGKESENIIEEKENDDKEKIDFIEKMKKLLASESYIKNCDVEKYVKYYLSIYGAPSKEEFFKYPDSIRIEFYLRCFDLCSLEFFRLEKDDHAASFIVFKNKSINGIDYLEECSNKGQFSEKDLYRNSQSLQNIEMLKKCKHMLTVLNTLSIKRKDAILFFKENGFNNLVE